MKKLITFSVVLFTAVFAQISVASTTSVFDPATGANFCPAIKDTTDTRTNIVKAKKCIADFLATTGVSDLKTFITTHAVNAHMHVGDTANCTTIGYKDAVTNSRQGQGSYIDNAKFADAFKNVAVSDIKCTSDGGTCAFDAKEDVCIFDPLTSGTKGKLSKAKILIGFASQSGKEGDLVALYPTTATVTQSKSITD